MRPWGVDRQALTPGAREVVCIAGAVDSFAEASDVVLRKMADMRVSESTVQRTSEAAGQTSAAGWPPGRPSAQPAVELAQGCRGEDMRLRLARPDRPGHARPARPRRPPGRMTAVGMVYNPVPDDPASMGPTPTGRRRGSRRATSRGWTARRRWPNRCGSRRPRWAWTRPSGGSPCATPGPGLEDLLGVNFPRVEAVILDFYHPRNTSATWAAALYPGDESAREEWIERWCHRLKHEGGRGGAGGAAGDGPGGPRSGPESPW